MAEIPESSTPPPEPGENRPASTLPRRNVPAERQAQAAQAAQTGTPDLNEQLASLQDTVRALAQHVVGEPVPEADFTSDRAGRRAKKFTRRGTGGEERTGAEGSAPAEPGPTEAAAPNLPPPPEARRTDAPEFNKNVAWPRAGQAEAAEAEALTGPKRKRPNKKLVLVAVQLIGLALLAVGYLLGRSDAPAAAGSGEDNLPGGQPPPDSSSAFRVSERDLALANSGLHSARAGDTAEARRIFREAADKNLALPGVHYELARLALASGDLLTADIHLDHSTNANEFVAACCYSRARFAGMKGNYAEVVRQFQTAVHAEPFNGKSFFYWGEALRRAGNTRQAIEALDQARDRAHTPAEETLYLFKQRLARAESGGDQAFDAELTERLKEQPAPADWLLLAAAKSINAGNHAGAVEFLRQAANGLPSATYNLWTKDFLFQATSNDPSLTALLRRPAIPDSTEKDGVFLDPNVGPPELMDPAIWPVGVAGNKRR